MRRRAAPLLLSVALSGAVAILSHTPGHAQSRTARGSQGQPATARQSGPPHAWLFGVWTGGLFPVLDGMLEQDCKAQPTVVFSQDVVGHTSLTAPAMTRRVIETVRTSPAGAEFRLTPEAGDPGAFGCEDPNVLHVARENGATISFPHCAAFPYPLERCPAPAR